MLNFNAAVAYADNNFQPQHYHSQSSPTLYQQQQRPEQLHPKQPKSQTRFNWLNCALRADKAVYLVSIGQQWLVLGGIESV